MRIKITMILLALCSVGTIAHSAAAPHVMSENVLSPFVSDGCSKFPDGVPLANPKLWLNCCIRHDIAYWQGGSRAQRQDADSTLRACVSEAASPLIGNSMYVGVRLGGFQGSPFTWRWGYGWTRPRGYEALSDGEQRQVTAHLATLPNDLLTLPILSLPVFIRERASVTGNYCLDEAARILAGELQPAPRIERLEEVASENAVGFLRTFSIHVGECLRPYVFEFQLLRKNACTEPESELLARTRVRLLRVTKPENCH